MLSIRKYVCAFGLQTAAKSVAILPAPSALKQTFSVRYNLLHERSGHIWGDRYWSEILEVEPPEEAEKLTGPVMWVEASEFSPALDRVSPLPFVSKSALIRGLPPFA
jgi:hypothetical protein